MKNKQLTDLVAVHHLPINWLAKQVGRCSERSFRYWLHGRSGAVHSAPMDVLERLANLNTAITKALTKPVQSQCNFQPRSAFLSPPAAPPSE